MQGNLAMMNWAQIRLSSSPHRIFGGAKKQKSRVGWRRVVFAELNCHTTKIKHLTLCDEEFPGRAIKGEPESWFPADEARGGIRRESREAKTEKSL